MKALWIVALVVLSLVGAGWVLNQWLVTPPNGPFETANYQNGRFVNQPAITERASFIFLRIAYKRLTDERTAARPAQPLPVKRLSRQALLDLPRQGIFVVKLVHSTVLLKVNGEFWLIDPIFSERASPVSFAGPERFHPLPIDPVDLPPIDRVLISHNHYDHLDKNTIALLAAHTPQYYVPLGVTAQLSAWGVAADAITTLNWHEQATAGPAKVTLTPSQHFSGRGFTDRNKTLWGSYVVATASQRVFFSGDSGYFDGFKKVGQRYGPFDLAFVESGAYASLWPQVHMTPAQSVQAANDLQARYWVPVHNSSFDLAFHPWYAPLEGVSQHADNGDATLLTPQFGQLINVASPPATSRWWQAVMTP